jgi:hypothetical protein
MEYKFGPYSVVNTIGGLWSNGKCIAMAGMKPYFGKEVTIAEVDEKAQGYSLEECTGYGFCEECFE